MKIADKLSSTLTQRFWTQPAQGPWSLGLIVILVIAFVLRMWGLDMKPPHFDEGINGHFVMKMWQEGFYKYDPTNFHGPLYFYLLQITEVILGKSIWAYRFMTGLLSIGIVCLVAMHRRFVGNGALWAAFFVAISPAFVFYSRYAIHESLFILSQVLFSYGYFLWREQKSRAAAVCMVAGFIGAFTTKETFFIFFGTWAIAVACVRVSIWLLPPATDEQDQLKVTKSTKSDRLELLGASVVGALAALALFSGFFMNLPGIGDMFKALAVWTKTGVGATGHEKPFLYWAKLFWAYEWPFMIGAILTPIAFFMVNRAGRTLVIAGFGTLLAYSLIPYKTPWLNLNFLWMLAFTLGFMMTKLAPSFLRWGVRGLALVAVSHTLYTSWRLNFRDYTKAGEPYVYVQSTMDFKNVMYTIETHVKKHPEDLNMVISVLNRDTWPMPWTLSDYPNRRWGDANSADVKESDVVLVDDSTKSTVEPRLTRRYFMLPFQIRDAYEKGTAFFSVDKFSNSIPQGTPVFEPAAAAVNTGAPTSQETQK